jgi:transcriptional regulator with XRE-family HTH domain
VTRGKKVISKVSELRAKAGLTQKQLADMTDTTVVTVSNWERNRTGVEQIVRLAKLCKALNCFPEDLYEEVEENA